ncbi:MAG: AMP-dependent synthetase, partial [Rhodococcus erythropolis]
MVSVLDPVTRHAEVTPDNIAIRNSIAIRGTAEHWTYRQLHDASLAFAGRIRDAGLSVGDRVLLAAPSVAEFVVAYMGIQAAGCVV